MEEIFVPLNVESYLTTLRGVATRRATINALTAVRTR
jgi:hypothetical protein